MPLEYESDPPGRHDVQFENHGVESTRLVINL